MKKLFFSLIATVFFSIIGVAQDLSKLSEDLKFISYVENQIKFNSRFNFLDINTLKEIIKDSNVSETELKIFYKLLSTDEISYKNYIDLQKEIMVDLNSKYGLNKLNGDELKNVLNNSYITYYSNNSSLTERKNCRSRYLAEIALAGSIAYGAHLACNGAALAGPLAYYGCHAAVAAGQLAASYIALDNYQECMGK